MAFIVPYAFKIAIAILKAYGVFWVSGKWKGVNGGREVMQIRTAVAILFVAMGIKEVENFETTKHAGREPSACPKRVGGAQQAARETRAACAWPIRKLRGLPIRTFGRKC